MEPSSSVNVHRPHDSHADRLSYKFQRLRERLRQAVVAGELTGKLPGERELGRRFKANPKTIGKALTDLAAEGLLDRSIGRGTYVRGSDPQQKPVPGRWLILCDGIECACPLILQLLAAHARAEITTPDAAFRPSLINQFTAVIDMAHGTPPSLHRDLLVRGVPVLLVEKESGDYRVNSVLLDRVHAAAVLAREMVLAGHRRILVFDDALDGKAVQAARTIAARCSAHVQVDACTMDRIPPHLDLATGLIFCQRFVTASHIQSLIARHPQLAGASIATTGVCAEDLLYTGIYLSPAELVTAVVHMLKHAPNHRPTSLWLSGRHVDRGTIRIVSEPKPAPRPNAAPAV